MDSEDIISDDNSVDDSQEDNQEISLREELDSKFDELSGEKDN